MQLVKEPGFTSVSGMSVNHGFYVGSSPAQFLTLNFAFDYFAHEVAYELKSVNDDVVFALAWFDTFAEEDESATMIIPIYGPEWGDQTYTLRLWDNGNDGICCSWGNGGYQLYLGHAGENNLLRNRSGNYGSGESFQFVVEGLDPPTMSPTPSPTMSPTPNPTTPPTPAPTIPPITPYPTDSPSFNPTSTEPTQSPSRTPSLGPSPSPSEPTSSITPTPAMPSNGGGKI